MAAQLYTEVVPNAHNNSGFVIIIYKRTFFWPFAIYREIGRVTDEGALERFLDAYEKRQRRKA